MRGKIGKIGKIERIERREIGNSGKQRDWIPAFAGMTASYTRTNRTNWTGGDETALI
jgi:hypothetical protein